MPRIFCQPKSFQATGKVLSWHRGMYWLLVFALLYMTLFHACTVKCKCGSPVSTVLRAAGVLSTMHRMFRTKSLEPTVRF